VPLFLQKLRKLGCSDKKPRAALVKSITPDRYGIDYSAIGFKAEGVRAVPLASYYGGTCYEASAEATFSGKYPIARYRYIYLNKKPN